MKLEINDTNLSQYVDGNNNIVIIPEFLVTHNLIENGEIKITKIHDKTVKVLAVNIDNTELKIEIKDCSFKGCFFEKCKLKELHLLSLEVSERNENKFKPYNFYLDNCQLDSVWTMYGKFYEGFLIKNNCTIKSIRISDSLIENSLSFINSKAESFEIESSQLEYLRIDRSDYPVKDSITEIDKINIFRTTLILGFRIWDVKFKKISIYKISVTQSESLSDHEKTIHISAPKDYEDGIESIEISESNFERDLIISIDRIKEFYCYGSSFKYWRLNFWNVSKFEFKKNIVNDAFFLGFQNHRKKITDFYLSSNTFSGDFYISDILFKEKFNVIGSTFQKFPSFIESCFFTPECETEFEFSNFSNLIFQDVRFENVSFKNFDILNATFRNCEWKNEKGAFYSRNIVWDETKEKESSDNLIQAKKVYADLKSNFQDKNDYINSSKFYISEQEVKRKIAKKYKSRLEYFLLTIHKFLSIYGESISKVVFVLIISLFAFSLTYFFTGFKSGNERIKYLFEFDVNNLGILLKDFLKAFILSVKNLVPFPVNNQFYIYTDKDFAITQTIELLQKIFNFIVLASFTETFLKNLKK